MFADFGGQPSRPKPPRAKRGETQNVDGEGPHLDDADPCDEDLSDRNPSELQVNEETELLD